MNLDQTITAIATGENGAIGIVRLSGADALKIADKIFRPIHSKKKPSEMRGYTGALGKISDASGELDEAVAFVYKEPHSYTGEDCVEFCVHGGRYLLEKVMAATIEAGAVPASPGEFTRRALMNGKMELTQAESVADMIASENRQSLRAALGALDGVLHRGITEVTDSLIQSAAHLTAWTDYPDEGVEEIDDRTLEDTIRSGKQKLGKMIAEYGSGKMMREGITTAIVGSVNVGKSTLMNLLSGTQKSIVTSVPGTTRDVIEERVNLGEVTLLLQDTAGIRDTKDMVEKIGVTRSIESIERCDLILAVFDSSRSFGDEDRELLEKLKGKLVIGILNKADLENKLTEKDTEAIRQNAQAVLSISAEKGKGLEELSDTIRKVVGIADLNPQEPILANARQLSCAVQAEKSLGEALEALEMGQTLDAVSVCVEEALQSLLELSGKQASSEIIDKVFETFCVGK